jgi:hypothetical protein
LPGRSQSAPTAPLRNVSDERSLSRAVQSPSPATAPSARSVPVGVPGRRLNRNYKHVLNGAPELSPQALSDNARAIRSLLRAAVTVEC